MTKKYCESIYQTQRWKTREIMVGNVGVGGNNPIRIQSMTTSNTRDVEATVDQAMRLADSGCEIVRVTVQGMKEADACEGIKNRLLEKGYTIPLVADIHFFPPAALRVAEFVDKVRINPGNFVDKRASFKTIEYDDLSYALELEKIEEKFAPLVEKCKRLKRAMRIGTNHGSLSDRIMNRFGDTPEGMIQSAVEFANICRKYEYHDFLFSMKSSNPRVMIQAYRLLVAKMIELGWNYPLHLGVTEAGEGEDGRIKSAIGIGSLLLDGLGDTIRVSLTEDPWHEIDPCKRLMSMAKSYEGKGVAKFEENHRAIDSIQRRTVIFSKEVAFHRDGTVIVAATSEQIEDQEFYPQTGCDQQLSLPKLKNSSIDGLVITEAVTPIAAQKLKELANIGITIYTPPGYADGAKMVTLSQAIADYQTEAVLEKFAITSLPKQPLGLILREESEENLLWIEKFKPAVLFLSPKNNRLHYSRKLFEWLQSKKIEIPVILAFSYQAHSKEQLIIEAAAEYGALLCDGLGEGICIDAPYEIDFLRQLSFGILQASRMRSIKTDFISCPSCGRTLFNLQEVSKKIRERTSHLPGVKIAIMGCIVNGPGEMADADFGYVGSKPGMIDLYVGKLCVEKDISFDNAVERLVDLIKHHGRWVEPEEAVVLT